jgi:hypothetical protein
MHLYAQKYQICKNMQNKFAYCNQDFMNRIYIILGYNFDCVKKYAKSYTSEL